MIAVVVLRTETGFFILICPVILPLFGNSNVRERFSVARRTPEGQAQQPRRANARPKLRHI
jgi:hypothetical protein